MTIETFLKKLSKLRYKKSGRKLNWIFKPTGEDKDKNLRTESGGRKFCPITAVCYAETGLVLDPWDVDVAATSLGLSSKDTDKIVDAADLKYGKKPSALRNRILDACTN